jgi:hypothetical protein
MELTELRDDLFRFMSLPFQCAPEAHKPYLKKDRFSAADQVSET